MLESLNSDKFEYKRIPLEEQKKRGILGRLVGCIADFKNPTRNGRLYSEALWDGVFDNPIMQERIKNRVCFGELQHPADREEVDPEKVAVCLAEQPKKGKDGKLYGVFDILNTPNGRILKSFCDYGCNVGISSRGTGDLYTDNEGNEAVDPDTYDCVGWDVVLIPGVESARLQYVTESLDTKKYNKTLRQKLTEQLKAASEEDRKIMEESLEGLDINLKEDTMTITNDEKLDSVKDEIVPEMEFDNDIEFISEEEADKIYDGEVNGKYPVMKGRFIIKNPTVDGEPVDGKVVAIDNSTEDAWTEEFDSEEEAIKWLNGEFEVGEEVEEQFYLRHDDLDKARDALLNEVDHEELLKALLAKNMKDETIEDLCRQFGVESKEFGYNMMTPDEMEAKYGTRDIKDLLKDESISENCGDKKEEAELKEEAGNTGDDLLVSELQETLLKNKELEEDNLSLQEKLSVCNAKEVSLDEELKKYKASTAALSETAKEVKSLKEENNKLSEDLKVKEKLLESNKQRFERLVGQKKEYLEKLNNSDDKIKQLENQITGLNESLDKANQKIDAFGLSIKKYRKALDESRDSYIKAKADSYNLSVDEVKSNLNESYKLKDVDSICEDLYNQKKNLSKLPFRITEDVKIKVKPSGNESIRDKFFDDDNIDSLLKMTNYFK